jgi:hypothetical protein
MKTFINKYVRFCPRTGKFLGVGRMQGASRVLFPFIGLAAMVWILIRVIPKPSRLTYPCVRTAMPIASGFIGYLAMLALSSLAFLRSKKSIRYYPVFFIAAFAVFGISGSVLVQTAWQPTVNFVPVPNQPMGIAKGVFPGRVAWVHDSSAVNENCVVNSPQHPWYFSENMRQWTVDSMLSVGLKSVTGETTDSAAWNAVFHFHNIARGKGDVGYVAGQKVFIKMNATSAWSGNFNTGDLSAKQYISETSLASVRAVMRQLVNVVHVAQADIYLGDPMKHIYKHIYDTLHAEFPSAHYLDNSYTTLGREMAVKSTTAIIHYSDNGTVLRTNSMSSGGTGVPVPTDSLYAIFETAEYVINIPQLKGHVRAGITMFAKNHFGSHTRPSADHLHMGLVRPYGDTDPSTLRRTDFGVYRVQVDLMEHSLLSGKNLIYIMDALWATDQELGMPLKWQMAPFRNTYSASLFVSFDPVAIESAGYDFLRSEFTVESGRNTSVQMPGVDDYLHQAADSLNWPDSVRYDPNNTGVHIKSLGVHEHWNNPIDMQYSRNLSVTGTGIELIKIERNPAYFGTSLASCDFDTVLTSATKTDSVTVTCSGKTSLIIDSVQSASSEFAILPSTAAIAPGSSAKFAVTFAPTSAGPKSGSIIFYHNGVSLRDTITVSGVGKVIVSVQNLASTLPKEYQLFNNYPNPFNPSTTISYALPEKSAVQIAIYDVQGRIVKSFAFGAQSAGYQRVVWNGRNDQGTSLASGVYIYRVKASSLERTTSFDKSAKMILLK